MSCISARSIAIDEYIAKNRELATQSRRFDVMYYAPYKTREQFMMTIGRDSRGRLVPLRALLERASHFDAMIITPLMRTGNGLSITLPQLVLPLRDACKK
jgi:hypothetical protein